MYIAFACASVVFFIAYLISSIFIYKKNTGNNFKLSNSFGYELFLSKKKEMFVANLLLLISLALVFATSVIYLVNSYSTNRLLSCLVLFVGLCAFGASSIIPLSKLKEHFACSILSFGTLALFGVLLLFMDIRDYQIEFNKILIISLVFDSVVTIIGVVAMFNPRVTSLNMSTDSEGNLVRPKYIPLAFFEWLTIFGFIIAQISIIIISLI